MSEVNDREPDPQVARDERRKRALREFPTDEAQRAAYAAAEANPGGEVTAALPAAYDVDLPKIAARVLTVLGLHGVTHIPAGADRQLRDEFGGGHDGP